MKSISNKVQNCETQVPLKFENFSQLNKIPKKTHHIQK